MIITSYGYPLKFIQSHPVKDSSQHLKSFVYKFFSTKTKLHYVVRAEQHNYNFFAIKFYAKKHRKSERKYNIIVNKGDVANILVSCAKVVPEILKEYPDASFGLIGSRSFDTKSHTVEGYMNNQRFRLYKPIIPQIIGNEKFQHVCYERASSYGLINKSHSNMDFIEDSIKNMVIDTYNDILSID